MPPRALPGRPAPTIWKSPARRRCASDPRPSYQHDPQRVYGMEFAGLEVHFTVDGAQLTVQDITLL